MDDGVLLMRAICEKPEEDTPRLIYADYLQELGGKVNERRAEFILLQCEVAKMTMTCEKIERDDKRLSFSWSGQCFPTKRCRCDSCRIARRLLKLSCPDTEMSFMDSMSEFNAPKHAYSPRWVRGFPHAVRCNYEDVVNAHINWSDTFPRLSEWVIQAVRAYPITEFDIGANALARLMERREQRPATFIHDRERDAFRFNFHVIDSEERYFPTREDAFQWLAKHLGRVARKEAGLPPLSTPTETNAA